MAANLILGTAELLTGLTVGAHGRVVDMAADDRAVDMVVDALVADLAAVVMPAADSVVAAMRVEAAATVVAVTGNSQNCTYCEGRASARPSFFGFIGKTAGQFA